MKKKKKGKAGTQIRIDFLRTDTVVRPEGLISEESLREKTRVLKMPRWGS